MVELLESGCEASYELLATAKRFRVWDCWPASVQIPFDPTAQNDRGYFVCPRNFTLQVPAYPVLFDEQCKIHKQSLHTGALKTCSGIDFDFG